MKHKVRCDSPKFRQRGRDMSRAGTEYFLPSFLSAVRLQTDSIATELCISMYNCLLISWLAHHAKKVSGNVEQRHFSSPCLSDRRRNDRSNNLLGTSTSSALYRLAEVEV